MVQLIRTNSDNKDFVKLVKDLDVYLKTVDGDDHSFYNQFNSIDHIKYVLVAYIGNQALGCGAFKEYDSATVELKRMYTSPNHRGKGIATSILLGLENWASELSYTKCILETGKRQVEAVQLYKKSGYQLTPNYGQYIGVENSICFSKMLNKA